MAWRLDGIKRDQMVFRLQCIFILEVCFMIPVRPCYTPSVVACMMACTSHGESIYKTWWCVVCSYVERLVQWVLVVRTCYNVACVRMELGVEWC